MKTKLILAVSILLLSASISVNAMEIVAEFKEGKPTQKEFVLAAKRVFLNTIMIFRHPSQVRLRVRKKGK